MRRARTLPIAIVFLAASAEIGCESAEMTRRVERLEKRIDNIERINSAKLKIDRVATSLAMIDDEVETLKESRNDTTIINGLPDLVTETSEACATATDAAAAIETDLARLQTDLKVVELGLDALADAQNAVEAYEELSAMLAVIEEKLALIDDEVERLKEAGGDTSTVFLPDECDGYSEKITAIENTIADLTAAIAAAREKIASGT